MPIIRSAIKKMRQDKKRTERNILVKRLVKKAIKNFKDNPSIKLFSQVDRALSGAAKKKIIHANKAARLKSRLSKMLGKKKESKSLEKPKISKTKKISQESSTDKKTTK